MSTDPTGKWTTPLRGGPDYLTNPASTSTNQWFGQLACTSSLHTIATTVVGSDDFVFLTMRTLGPVDSVVPQYAVTSIAPGVGFTIGQVASIAMTTKSVAAFWELKHTPI